jgi:hypothetical protein
MKLNRWYKVWHYHGEYYVKPYERYGPAAFLVYIYDKQISKITTTVISKEYCDNVMELSSLEQELL